MDGITFSTFFLLMLVSACFLTGVNLLLHRHSVTMGLFPLAALIGGLSALMQLHAFSSFQLEIWGRNIPILVGNYLFLPVILISLLVIHIINGSIQARVIIDGTFFVIFLVALIGLAKLFVPYAKYLPVFTDMDLTSRFLIAQTLSIMIAVVGMIAFYQAASNLRYRFPNWLAGGTAVLLAIWAETFCFHLIAKTGSPFWWQDFGVHIGSKSLLVLALLPIFNLYLIRIAPKMPDSVADLPRPTLDFFMSFEQLESHAQYSYSLLHTISQINQLIVHADDEKTLLQKACNALVELRNYHMVWIGTLGKESGQMDFLVHAGFSEDQVEQYIQQGEMQKFHITHISDEPVIVNDIRGQKGNNIGWQHMMLASGCNAAGIFPMRYGNRVLGILNICANQANTLGQAETDLIQELADDLAFALISLEAQKQQAVLHTATETMQDGLLIADLHGEIIYSNSKLAQIVGVDQNKMLGKNIDDLFSSEQLKLIPDTWSKLRQDEVLTFELPYQTLDARFTDISINATIVKDSKGTPVQLVANIRDISHLREYERQLLNLNRLTGELVQIRDTQTLMERILEMSEEILGANASGIYFADPSTRKIVDTLTHNLAAEYAQRIAKDYRGLPGETANKTLQPVFINDTLNDTAYGERIHFMAEYKIRSLIILPILFHDQPMGALTVYYHQPHTFSDSELQLGITLAQTLAMIIHNAQLYQAEQEQRGLAEALVEAAASLNSSLDLETVLDQILEQVMRVIPCKTANIQMIEDEDVVIRRHRGYEQFPEFINSIPDFKLSISIPNIQQMLNSGKAILIPDTALDPDWIMLPGTQWIKGYASAPLNVDGKIVGFLCVDTDKPNLFTEETVGWLQIFTDHAATAIKNAQLFHAELKQRELAEALSQAAASVSSSLELADVLDQILVQAMRVVPGQAANIMLIEGDKVRMVHHRGYENYVEDPSIYDAMETSMSWPGLQEMYKQVKPIVMMDIQTDERWHTTPDANWVRSFIGIPLVVDREVVGFLNIDSDKPNFLTDEFLPRLQTFADYASAAIKNARSYEGSRQRAEEMAALVSAASAVSKNLDYLQVLRVIAMQMINLLRIQACVILSYDSNENRISFLVEHGLDNPDLISNWGNLGITESFITTRRVLDNHIPIQIQAGSPDLTPIQHQFMQEAGVNTLLLLPLVTQDRTIGLVVLLVSTEERVFSVREITLGLSLASHAATAMENAHLYHQLQKHAMELEGRVKRRTQELQEATEYIEGILASVPDAVFVLDQKHQLARANQAGEYLLAQAQSIGLDLFNPQLLQILKNGIEPDLQSVIEVGERAYQGLSSQLLSDDGQPGGQIIVFRDVTRFRELDQMKTKFVSDVSHELRTPLTNLTLYLGLLASVRDQNRQKDYIQTLQRETERLTHLIEDLLTISRLEASRIQFFIRPTNLNQLTENLVRDRTILAAQKEITTEFVPAADAPLASADENMLTQAVSNLLTNAINYTQPGGSIQIYIAQPEPNWVTIQIADTGVGIPPEELEHIFDRFYRGYASQQTGAEGTGLGLAISEEIIYRMGGKITLESIPGEGSTFTIWLKSAPDSI